MFDIGFPELLLISIVALLVIGPDKLPATIRTMSLWMGRFRRSFSKIKQEIENEIGADEIKAQLYNESIMQDLEKSRKTLQEVKDKVTGTINEVDSAVSEIKATPAKSLTETPDKVPDKVSAEEQSNPLKTKPLTVQE
jgi:sec-independent protein translocase protein TatB